MINKAVIVCGGDDYSADKIRKSCNVSDFIIAADRGMNILDGLLIKPDFFLGDMDSIDKKLLKKYSAVKHEIYDKNKDLTDSELAIKKALSLKPSSIDIFAATGNYADHTYANILNLLKYSGSAEIMLITDNSEIFILNKNHVFENLKGRRLSFFPLKGIKNLKMSGFKYTFKNKQSLSIADYSISNVITGNKAEVNYSGGPAFCVLFDKGFK